MKLSFSLDNVKDGYHVLLRGTVVNPQRGRLSLTTTICIIHIYQKHNEKKEKKDNSSS